MIRDIRFKYFLYSVLVCKLRIISIFVLFLVGICFKECSLYVQNVFIGAIASTIATIIWSVLDSYKACIKARTKITLSFRILINNINRDGLGVADIEVKELKVYINELENAYINVCALAEDLTYKHDFDSLLSSLRNLIDLLKKGSKPALIKASIDNIEIKLNLF